jgi:hypothetical protein
MAPSAIGSIGLGTVVEVDVEVEVDGAVTGTDDAVVVGATVVADRSTSASCRGELDPVAALAIEATPTIASATEPTTNLRICPSFHPPLLEARGAHVVRALRCARAQRG